MRMVRANQTSFTAGEIGPEMAGRINVAFYYSGAQMLRNVLTRPQGGVLRRPGMAHVHEFAGGDGIAGARVLPFAFNTEQTYAIVLTAGKLHAFRSDGLHLATVTGCPWTATQAAQMNWTQSADTLLLFHPDMPPQRVTRGAAETVWTVATIAWSNLPQVNFGGLTPAGTMTLSAMTGSITLISSAGLFVAGHVGWELRGEKGRARIESVTSASVATATVLADFALDAVTPGATVTPSATTGSITLTADLATFRAEHVGWEFRGNAGRARIDAVTNAGLADATVLEDFFNLAPLTSADWTLGSTALAATEWEMWEPIMSAARGWPECGHFYQARLVLAGFRSKPATFAFSKISDFFNFDQGTALDDEAILATIDTDQVNAIHQIVATRGLQLLTSGAEHVITGDPITPKSIGRQEQTRRGVKRFVPTCEVDGATFFIQRQGAALRQFLYIDVEQAWRSDLASLLAPHLIGDPTDMAARKTARQDDADRILLVNSAGTVTVLTTLRSQEVTAFTRWETNGTIRSVAALLSGEVFFLVQRYGSVRLEAWSNTALLDASKRRTETTPFSSVTGLAHLEGTEVAIMADGAYLGTATVAGGAVTLPRAASTAEIGLLFPVRIEPMPIEPRDQSGALIGRKSRLTQITARVRDSGTFTIAGEPALVRGVGTSPTAPLDTPPPIRSGDVIVRGQAGWRYKHVVVIEQPVPQPLEILALGYEMRLAD